MRYAIVAACAVAALAGCKKPRRAPEPSKQETAAERPPPAEAGQAEEAEPETRLERLEREWGRYDDHVISHSAAVLPEGEREMLGHLLEAARLVEELHMVQIDPNNVEWFEEVSAGGDEIERKVYLRYQMPWCADDDSPECCAMADCPEKRIGYVHWPRDMTDEEFASLGDEPNAEALLSPFTMVRRKTGGGYHAVPYTDTETFGPRMKRVAEELRAAAEHAPHPSLAKFLRSRADAFEASDPFPYDESDYDWIALEGDWEVTVGPYETYKNPHQLKALFQMYIGREDRELTAELARFREGLQDMEDALARLVGEDVYRSRKLDPRISIRAVDVWMAAGDGRRDRGATVAFHLPNRGQSVEEGLYKKVMMVNHSKAFEEVMHARARRILAEEHLDDVDIRADITNVTFHELAHGFGAYHEMEIETAGNGTTTVKAALGEYDSLFEELKADTFGLWLLGYQDEKGWVDDDGIRTRITTALMHILGLLQYPLSGTYPQMVAIQLGFYMDRGAVTWDGESGRFGVNVEKMPAAVEALAREVATIQLTGDRDAAERLYTTYITDTDDGPVLEGALGEARRVMLDEFEKAGIRSPSLRYEVTGL
jgi:hypothetical protein